MAEHEILAPSRITDLPPTTTGGPGEDLSKTELMLKLRRRFLYAWNHPKWKRWRDQSQEDHDFHSGKEQWPKDIRAQLEGTDRAILQINEIRPVVEVVTGFERASRLEIRPVPEGPEDIENVTILSRIMKRASKDQELDFVMSDGFKEGVIGGLAVWFVGIDYTEDPINGRLVMIKTKRGSVIWDPDRERYDLGDAREVFWHKMVAVDLIKAQYPDKADLIESALTLVKQTAAGPADTVIPSQDPRDAYKTDSLDSISFYDGARDEVRIMEVWYRVWDRIHLIADKRRNTVEEIPKGPDVLRLARALAEQDPEVKVIERFRKRIEMSVILPAINM
ncbi:hypothetical protein LCGC14_2962800, partial [marine sediment metagenome]